MVQDPRTAILKVSAFLGLGLDNEEQLVSVLKNSSMKEMQTGAGAYIGLNHLRKGGYGGWREYFTVAMSELFDDVFEHKMSGSGIRFNFGPDSRGRDIVM